MWRILTGYNCYLSKYYRRNSQLNTVRNLKFPVAILSVGLTESCHDYHYRKFTETNTNLKRKNAKRILSNGLGSKPYCSIVTVLYPFLSTYIVIAEKLRKTSHGIFPLIATHHYPQM
jgi:hypothetical protein